MKKKILIWGGSVLAFLLVLVVVLFIFRSRVLQYTIERVITKVENKYPADLNIGNAEFVDWNSVVLNDISFVPHNLDTLFTTDSVYATVSFRSIFKGRIVFKRLEVRDGYLTARKNGDVTNFAFLFKKDEPEEPVDTTKGRNYGYLLNRVIETAFDNVPDQVDFTNLNASYKSPNRFIDVRMPYLRMDDGYIESQVSILADSIENNMRVRGTIDPGDYNISASLYAFDKKGIRLPYVKRKYEGEVAFDTLHLSLNNKRYKNEKLTVKGRAMVDNLVVNHAKLNDEDIVVNESAIDYVVTLGEDLFVIDSATEVRVNEAKANIYAAYESKPTKIYDLQVKTDWVKANNFFNSLPAGLFENLDGIKAQGELKYKMNFHLNMDSLDYLTFNSDLDASKDFKVVQWGYTNLEKINGSFVHTVYEYGKPVRTFNVGPSNPFYTPISQISPHLRNAILTAEDAGYYSHKGFHEEAFRQAIIKNIEEGEFARGGSTISMQLVKNVFLSRKKTVGRKVEEAIIVWLIENQNLVPKSRMFEVYLNIIEWGPDVYGAKDASRFYFGKEPSELNLNEAIFLTSIIPSPKRYRSSFDSYGNLRSHKGYYYRLIGGIMRRRGLISQEEYDNLYPNVKLYGRARDLIVTAPDAVEEDTTEYELETIDLLDF
ncbi:biosynthetic peptidoglycan transglycosylase [Pontibacter cellulosilyticus]|uniref:Transglycosylase domain-containing protein n=1 Tax=Pontibacter cellulosilyticus TaxID=1720253 RepID=A0A923NCY9_9BACT|nr:biosynthetic peptidoglycan transglycosylase [Pontibacter cellulosilyticus]MBC5994655.1 transglycosylase domain-containing protein [Pontibacter cellulosilyticus]